MRKTRTLVTGILLLCGRMVFQPAAAQVAATAADSASSAVSLFQTGEKYWKEGYPEKARQEWERAVAQDPKYALAHLYLGKYHLRAGNLPSAEEQLALAQQYQPSAEALTLMVRCRILQNDLGTAQDLWEQARALSPRSLEVRLAGAEISLLRDDLEEAEALVTEVEMVDHKNARALYLQGRIAEAKGNLEEAFEHYRTALEVLLHEP